MTPSIKRARSRQLVAKRRNERLAVARLVSIYAETYAIPSWMPWVFGIAMLVAFGLPFALAWK